MSDQPAKALPNTEDITGVPPPLHGSTSLVGVLGEFTAADGEVCQCIVRAHDDPPWADDCLVVDYVWPNGLRVDGAWIGRDDFRPAPAWTAEEIADAKERARELEQLFEPSQANND